MSGNLNLAMQIERGFQRHLQALTVYEIVAGDTLCHIIRKFYGIGARDTRYAMALAHVMYFNPAISDPNQIRVGQLLRLPPIDETEDAQPYCSMNDFQFDAQDYGPTMNRVLAQGPVARMAAQLPKTQPERDIFFILAWLHQNYDYLSIGAGSGMSTWGNLVADGNRALIQEVNVLYAEYQAGRLTKG